MNLSEYKVLTFDVYGILIDWESGMIEGLKPHQKACSTID
jgi:2-haloacid dehalogenase